MGRRSGVVAIVVMAFMGLAAARGPPVDGAPDACQACLVSVRILEDFLCDPAATDFLVDFVEKQVCPYMGDKAQCHNLAEGLLPTVVQWFRASATPASLCASSGVCGQALMDVPALNKPALRVSDGPGCAMCKYVVRKAQAAVNSSVALEKIKEVALKICSELPDEVGASCSDFVDKYEPMLVELVETLDPDTICALLGPCLAAAVEVKPPPLPAALVRILAGMEILHRPPPPPMFAVMASLGMPPPFGPPGGPGGVVGHFMHSMGMGMGPRDRPEDPEQQQQQPEHGPRGDGPHGGEGRGMMHGGGPMGPANDACDYCKMAIIEAHSLVSNPTVQQEVLNYTKAVCDSFPTFAEACKAYADMYAPLVFSLLEQYLVPDTLCAETGMCPPPPPPPPAGSWMCWLMDGWLGEALRGLGLGGLLPHHPEPQPLPLALPQGDTQPQLQAVGQRQQ